MFITLTVAIIQGIIFGIATQTIIDNKGYYDNWFWWGFFFGFIALIVACAKPQNITSTQSSSEHFSRPTASGTTDPAHNSRLLADGGWKCSCGKVQANYVFSCSCGKSKREVLAPFIQKQPSKEPEQTRDAENKSESSIVSAIKQYKELLDTGIITQEEFDAKKKQLLGL